MAFDALDMAWHEVEESLEGVTTSEEERMANEKSLEMWVHERAKQLFKEDSFTKEAWNAAPGAPFGDNPAVAVASRKADQFDLRLEGD